MKPAGTIVTYMSRKDWQGKGFWVKVRTIFFNICLFLFQLIFMVVGTAIGKIRWESRRYGWIDLAIYTSFAVAFTYIPRWWNIPTNIIFPLMIVASFRNIPWRRVWRAAQASHVRLVLKKVSPISNNFWKCINFGYPKAEIQNWHSLWNDGKRFEYREPTFTFSQDRIDNMIQYANDQVGKRYDWLQLLSPPANFPIWIIYWPWWGKEIIRWFNLPGAREFCSSGAIATLLWFAESTQVRDDMRILDGNKSEFFGTYDPAMVMPCMFVISENWRKV